jgi:hypothetical protein
MIAQEEHITLDQERKHACKVMRESKKNETEPANDFCLGYAFMMIRLLFFKLEIDVQNTGYVN